MREIRIHHPQPLADDVAFELTDTAARHLGKVLRLRRGDAFTVFDGSGCEWPAVLTGGGARTGKGRARDAESPLAVTLVQGISRGERMDWTIQKAVELGAAAIVPVFAARGAVRLHGERAARRLAHWRGIVVSACEQCGRNRVPPVHEPIAFEAYLDQLARPALLLDPEASGGLAAVDVGATLSLLAGPEGGFSDGERAAAVAAGCIPVRLGPRVLRTETAAVAALAALQALYGDLR